MAARICPYCRELNSVGEPRCHRCGRRLPGPVLDAVFGLARDALGVEWPMTRLILFINLAVFGLCVVANKGMIPIWPGDSFKGSTLLRFGALYGSLDAIEPWRLVSAVFVHASVLHVGMNMWMFTALGRELERELGGARLAIVFVATGLLGFVVSDYWYGSGAPITMGASGAVFGQIGAVVGVLLGRGDPEWKRALVRNIVYALILSLAMRNVNNAAHLGGLAAGVPFGFLFQRERGRFRLNRLMLALGGASLLLAVGSVVLSARSPAWQGMRAIELRYE
jgi:membrane associated rhomboid family serine protease